MIVVCDAFHNIGWVPTMLGNIPLAAYSMVPNMTEHRARCPPGEKTFSCHIPLCQLPHSIVDSRPWTDHSMVSIFQLYTSSSDFKVVSACRQAAGMAGRLPGTRCADPWPRGLGILPVHC